jgi:phenylpropionate dioxygenase-like ring-hydroxylating dioxygenase large terminal subunit
MTAAVITTDPERPFCAEAEHSYSLPAQLYTDPEIFTQEREAIFQKSWHYVGHMSDLPESGSYLTCSVQDEDLIVLRDGAGNLRAFYNVCQHRAHQLLEGRGRTRIITCPYHAWAYGLDGKLRGARGSEEVAGFKKEDVCLTAVSVELFCGFIFINLDPAATALAEQAGDLAGQIEKLVPGTAEFCRVATSSWTLEANWKVIIENYLECYHCEVAHPALASLLDMKSYQGTLAEAWVHLHYKSKGGSENKAYSLAADAPIAASDYWWLWPLTTFNINPGNANINVFHFVPLGPGKTLEVVEYFLPSDTMSEEEKAQVAYGCDTLQAEDNRICEAVQRGLRSRGYKTGRLMVPPDPSHLSERPTHHFQMMVASALGLAD